MHDDVKLLENVHPKLIDSYSLTYDVVVGGCREGVREDEWVEGHGLTWFHGVSVISERVGQCSRAVVVKYISDWWLTTFGEDTKAISSTNCDTLLREKTNDVRLWQITQNTASQTNTRQLSHIPTAGRETSRILHSVNYRDWIPKLTYNVDDLDLCILGPPRVQFKWTINGQIKL